MKNPRKRICVSIYIPDRHRSLLRGDEFNRRIPFTLVKSFQTYRVEFSTIFRIITSFDRRFLSFFSSLSFPFVFSFFTHTVAPRAPFHFAFASRTIPHSKYRSRPFSTDPRSPLATYSSLLPSPQNLATLQTNARTRVVFVRAAWRIGCVRSSAIRDPCPIRPTNKVVPVTSNV